ncbi:T-cell surface glycoprotein CD5 [Neolamprologus brichardi]|uniref:T-cell surface glycoprotein CD5 n=1 Tax=Neolamprologus brichardi TaxID=32507 RepID=UPI001643CBBA|nr:T-cell surface glycoprotein CD5 [Neolamprologus brichardi]
MDLRALVIISALLLVTNGNSQTPNYTQTGNYTVSSISLTSSPVTIATTSKTTNSENKAPDAVTSSTKCKAEKDTAQLKTYKVMTALLFCILLILFLMRFTRPTVKALQKRFSDRRQNRWIGPTQSHSVSYHRGKTAVTNNDGDKRHSYPALDRLVISDSREPSSNRNSDYNL